MKKITISNYGTARGQKVTDNGNTYTIIPAAGEGEADKFRASFIEVEPGSTAFGYHWHEVNEELFYIISGTALVRTKDGELTLRAGDAVTFPTGEEGAHVIRNASQTDKLIYLDFGTHNGAEIVHLPDINKIMAIGPYSNGIYDK